MIRANEIQIVPIKDIKLNPSNRNKHPDEQIDRLVKIIKYQGFRNPLIISSRTGLVVAGHGRYEAAKKLKLKEVPVMVQDFDSEEQEYAAQVSDNAIASWSELDLSAINQDIGDLGPDFDIDLLGIKGFEIEVADKFHGDEDDVPDNVEAKTKLGDVYSLGNHRLMCGDSTDTLSIDRLMVMNAGDLLFTDPPYGMNAVSDNGTLGGGEKNKKVYRKIIGDDVEVDASYLLALNIPKQIIWGGNFLAHKFPRGTHWIVWDKRGSEMKGGKEAGTQSDCELAWTNLDRNSVKKYVHVWAGWFRSGNKADELTTKVHPTQKPVGLCADIISEYSSEGAKIVDLYGGSGSTLIACEKTNRKCFMMELDPRYCDVIVARWENYTGKKAELLFDANTHPPVTANV